VVANRGNEKGSKGEQIAHLVSTSTDQPQKGTGKLAIAKMITDHLEQRYKVNFDNIKDQEVAEQDR
jgi:hypothetical protein